jgi:hypothetical protein
MNRNILMMINAAVSNADSYAYNTYVSKITYHGLGFKK